MGLLGVTSAAGHARQVEAMRQGFRDLGYDQLPALAGELIRLQPDVNVTSGPGTRIAMPDTPRREA